MEDIIFLGNGITAQIGCGMQVDAGKYEKNISDEETEERFKIIERIIKQKEKARKIGADIIAGRVKRSRVFKESLKCYNFTIIDLLGGEINAVVSADVYDKFVPLEENQEYTFIGKYENRVFTVDQIMLSEDEDNFVR